MTARRISGSAGFGGAVGGWFFFSPRCGPEPQVLKVGKGDAAHERTPMQPGPRSSLESPEAKLLLELLMGLLADGAYWRPWKSVRQVGLCGGERDQACPLPRSAADAGQGTEIPASDRRRAKLKRLASTGPSSTTFAKEFAPLADFLPRWAIGAPALA